MLRIDTIHHYQHPTTHVDGAHCRLRIYDNDAGAVVILSELADNTGISVTNAAEELATEIARLHRLTPDTTTWIEHYDRNSYRHADDMQETFDDITFTWRNGAAHAPQWTRLTATELLAILGTDIEIEYRLAREEGAK